MGALNCSCPIRPNMTFEEIVEDILRANKNCCEAAGWICGTLDKELRRADTERQRRNMYTKRLKRQGMTDEQIEARPQKKSKIPENFQPRRRNV